VIGDRWTVEIVCTDRGQHKRTWMARYIQDASSQGWRTFILGHEPKHDMHGPPEFDAEPGSVVSRGSVGFSCARCTRWPRIKWDTWQQLLTNARRGGLHEFDVSYLD
jgi:hypothetical protein